jgi:hypothetical protein
MAQTVSTGVQVGRTVRKKRHAKLVKVQAMAEGVIKFDAPDLSSVDPEAPPSKKVKLSKAERRAKHAAKTDTPQAPAGIEVDEAMDSAAADEPATEAAPKKSKKKGKKAPAAASDAAAGEEVAQEVERDEAAEPAPRKSKRCQKQLLSYREGQADQTKLRSGC